MALREVNRGTALGGVHGTDLLWRIDGWCNYLLRRFGCQVVKAVASSIMGCGEAVTQRTLTP